MKRRIEKTKLIFKNNGKVLENYFFMTALQIISSAFGILIYPYLIRTLGSASYGLYVYALTIASYFVGFVSFGFNLPGVKFISQNKDDVKFKSEVVSSIITAKFYLSIISSIVFCILLLSIPFLEKNKLIFSLAFIQLIAEIIFPVWYYQGVQKMKVVTYIQLSLRILSLPFIFYFIKTKNDASTYMIISSSTIIVSAIFLFIYLIRNEKLKIRLKSISGLKSYFNDALPFFWSSTAGTLKQESVTIIIGALFGMRDVAIYDLANKLIIIPRMLTSSINTALFPKVIENVKPDVVKKIIRTETYIGLAVILAITMFGYWIVWLLGGKEMLGSYPLAIILSFTILVWLVVGSYINFIFIPQNNYYYVTKNQIVAMISFFVICGLGLLIAKSIFVIVVALTLSGLAEIIYCSSIIKKKQLI